MRNQIELRRPVHNTRQTYRLGPQLPAEARRNLSSTTGQYQIIFELCVPGKNAFHETLSFGTIGQNGDSLLALPLAANGIDVQTAVGDEVHTVRLSGNQHRRLSKGSISLTAGSLDEAESMGYNVMMRTLSFLSYANDVALDISAYEVYEPATESRRATSGMIGAIKPFSGYGEHGGAIAEPQYRRLLAAFREGLNSSNAFYQALSFCKVFEGCKILRDEKNNKTVAAGRKPAFQPPRLPERLEDIADATPMTSDSFAPFLGGKFTAILDQHKHLVRNAIAHLDPRQRILDIDHFDDVATCQKALPLFAYMARRWIAAELESP